MKKNIMNFGQYVGSKKLNEQEEFDIETGHSSSDQFKNHTVLVIHTYNDEPQYAEISELIDITQDQEGVRQAVVEGGEEIHIYKVSDIINLGGVNFADRKIEISSDPIIIFYNDNGKIGKKRT
jgi:hypothetical protein